MLGQVQNYPKEQSLSLQDGRTVERLVSHYVVGEADLKIFIQKLRRHMKGEILMCEVWREAVPNGQG